MEFHRSQLQLHHSSVLIMRYDVISQMVTFGYTSAKTRLLYLGQDQFVLKVDDKLNVLKTLVLNLVSIVKVVVP